MKKFTTIVLSLLVASQAFAFGENERNALLGFGAGVIVTHLINKHNNYDTNYNPRVIHEQEIVYTRPQRIYNERYYVKQERKKHKHHYIKRHHDKQYNKHSKKHHRKHHDETVVVNHYRHNYYY